MKKTFWVLMIVLSVSVFAYAQGKPFGVIDDFLAKNGGDFDNREEIIKLFNQERVRLGNNFTGEVWKYLGSDLEKHYWISSFLVDDYYLGGNKPLSDLSLKIKLRGIELIGNSEELPDLGKKITFLRYLAIADALAGKKVSAADYKKQAEQILKKFEDVSGFVGAMSEYDYCIYDNLEKDISGCKP